ncbi:MAG TPA: type VI secretion system tube protein Hcp [Natronosporangium sp.]
MPGFVALGDIKGNATVAPHQGAIEFHSLRFGVTAGNPPVFDRIELVRSSDTASPALLAAASQGTVFDRGRLTIATAWGDQIVDYLVIELGSVTVERVRTAWDGGGLPKEWVTLGYRHLSWSAKPATPEGGAPATFAHAVTALAPLDD